MCMNESIVWTVLGLVIGAAISCGVGNQSREYTPRAQVGLKIDHVFSRTPGAAVHGALVLLFHCLNSIRERETALSKWTPLAIE
jgi:hypothetical protein